MREEISLSLAQPMSCCSCPCLLVPQLPPEPTEGWAPGNEGPALQRGDCGQAGPSRLGLLLGDTLGS